MCDEWCSTTLDHMLAYLGPGSILADRGDAGAAMGWRKTTYQGPVGPSAHATENKSIWGTEDPESSSICKKLELCVSCGWFIGFGPEEKKYQSQKKKKREKRRERGE